MIDKCAARSRHLDQGFHGDFPRGAIDLPKLGRDARKLLNRTVGEFDRIAHLGGPKPQLLELFHQIGVGLQKISRQRLALEEIRDRRLDAFIAAGDGSDRGRRRNGYQQAVSQAVSGDFDFQPLPALRITGRRIPGMELQLPSCGPGFREAGVRAALARKLI